jgi:HAD superfamily hydrolase (TIGR01509 family)
MGAIMAQPPIIRPVPEALLIDLDGTLVDSEPHYKRTEVETLNEFGVPITLEEMEEFTGVVFPVWIAEIGRRHGVAIDSEAFMAAYRPKMEAAIADAMEPFPDAEPFLLRTPQPKALVTSSMAWYVEAVLDRFGLAPWFDAVVCEADVVRGKPDPEPYLLAAGRLGVRPSDCLVLEDSQNGVLSGVAAGCDVVAVHRPGTRRPEGAHRTVCGLDELEL